MPWVRPDVHGAWPGLARDQRVIAGCRHRESGGLQVGFAHRARVAHHHGSHGRGDAKQLGRWDADIIDHNKIDQIVGVREATRVDQMLRTDKAIVSLRTELSPDGRDGRKVGGKDVDQVPAGPTESGRCPRVSAPKLHDESACQTRQCRRTAFRSLRSGRSEGQKTRRQQGQSPGCAAADRGSIFHELLQSRRVTHSLRR